MDDFIIGLIKKFTNCFIICQFQSVGNNEPNNLWAILNRLHNDFVHRYGSLMDEHCSRFSFVSQLSM